MCHALQCAPDLVHHFPSTSPSPPGGRSNLKEMLPVFTAAAQRSAAVLRMAAAAGDVVNMHDHTLRVTLSPGGWGVGSERDRGVNTLTQLDISHGGSALFMQDLKP